MKTELEWMDSNLNNRVGAQFHAVSRAGVEHDDEDEPEQTWNVCEDFDFGGWYLTNDWMADNLRIGVVYDTPDEVKALAQRLQDVLSAPKEP